MENSWKYTSQNRGIHNQADMNIELNMPMLKNKRQNAFLHKMLIYTN